MNHTSRPAPLVPGGPARSQDRPSATTTSGATPTRSTRTRASSSPTPSAPTGRGIRWPSSTSGTASSATSRTSTTTTPTCSEAMLDVMRFWLEHGRRRLPLRRRALPLRARGHQLREPARDARLPQASCARRSTREYPGTHAAGRGQPVARRRARRTSATATSSTWPSTSR